MKKRIFAIITILLVVISAFGCGKKNQEPIDLLVPEATTNKGAQLSVWENEKAGKLTFFEGNFVKVEFTADYEYLLKNYGDDSRNFDNNAEYRCNFYDKLNEVPMAEATSFYLWFLNGARDYNCQFDCTVEGNTMTLHSYWPYDSGELVFTKVG